MISIDKAPPSVKGWVAAEKAADPKEARRAVLSPDVVFALGPYLTRGVDAVLEVFVPWSDAGRLGRESEWSLLPAEADGRVKIRGTGHGGEPLLTRVPVPGDTPLREWVNYAEFTFTLDDRGLIVGIGLDAEHLEASDLARPLRPGDSVPDFVLPDFEGVKVPLRQAGAKATVVVFISNHCPYSLGWHDRLQAVGRDYAARGVRFLQINPADCIVAGTADCIARSRKRIAAGQFAGPYLVDEDQRVARRWGARYTPDVFVLDERGVIAYHGAPDADVDDVSLNARWLRGALDRVLAGAAPDPAETTLVGCKIKWAR